MPFGVTLEGPPLPVPTQGLAIREMTKKEIKKTGKKSMYLEGESQREDKEREGETKVENQIQEESKERGRTWEQQKHGRMRLKRKRQRKS